MADDAAHHDVHHYRTRLAWQGSTAVGYDAYSREHTSETDPPTATMRITSDPAFGGDPALLNPEQLLVAAASSCQLLSFLAAAARARIDVVAYSDAAEGEMPDDVHPMSVTRIVLRPVITVAPGPTEDRVRHLVEVGHKHCYIANSLRSEVHVEPVIRFVEADSNDADA